MTAATIRVSVMTAVMVGAGLGLAAAQTAPATPSRWTEPAIADNSFLIEEAFNQEEGVVQHISTFTRSAASPHDYVYTLTQEWPFSTQTHQLSYSVPVGFMNSTSSSGMGDMMFNYRYQMPGLGERVAISPRVSLVTSTGDVSKGLGTGSWGTQVNFPVSLRVTPAIAAHLNAGATLLPRMLGTLDNGTSVRRAVSTYTVGGSIIAPVTMPVNAVFEYVVNNAGEIAGDGSVVRETQHLFNPGVRFAINVGGTQVVPGVSVTIDAMHPGAPKSVLGYLSIEHAFRKIKN